MCAKRDQPRERKGAKPDVPRERPTRAPPPDHERSPSYEDIADIVGSVDGLPPDLSARTKHYLKAWGYGRKRRR
jgi:hypothetical protein